MAGRFSLKKFGDINLDDEFFDSLKADYPGTVNSTGFVAWFNKKAKDGATALVFEDGKGVGAFVVLKLEDEEIKLQNVVLSKKKRIKISTFRIAERYRRQRIGEGAIGLILWKWQQLDCTEIYVTVFDKHTTLISQFEKFGFQKCGVNLNGENVLIKSRERIGNKSVFNENELFGQYQNYKNVSIVELLYYGYFGAGNNVNMDWLDNNGYWASQGQYPTQVHLTANQFKNILMEGNVNVSNVIVN